jgi:HPt (histidine-containing phosphotransfer) domain-containing protein
MCSAPPAFRTSRFFVKPLQILADSYFESLFLVRPGGFLVVAGTVSRQKNTSESTSELFDRKEALARVDGDTELMTSLMNIFFNEAGPMMEAIRAAVGSNDSVKLEKAAHRMKGSVSIFGAHEVSQTAFELEKIGRSGDLMQVAATLNRLEQQMTSLQPALQQFLSELQPSS